MQENNNYRDEELYEIDLKEYMLLIWSRKWLITALVAAAVIISFFITTQMQQIYQTSTLLMVQTEGGAESLFSDDIMSVMGKNDKLVNTYSEIFTSRRIMESVITELEIRNEKEEYISAGALKEKITIQPGQETDLITLQVEYNDPEMAVKIANSVVENMQETIKGLNQASLTGASNFIDSQLKTTREQLSKLENKLLAYREENELLMPETQGKNMLNRYTNLETKKAEAELRLQEAEISLAEINKKLKGTNKKIISSESISRNPEIASIKTNLTSLYTQLEGLKTKYTAKHPEVKTVQAKINNLEKSLDQKTAEIVSGRTETNNPLYQNLNSQIIKLEVEQITAAAKIKVFTERLADLEEDLDQFPEAELNFLRLQREKNVTEEIYLLLRNRKEEINIQQAMQTSDIFVVDNAYLPEDPIRPKLKLNLAIAAVLAVMLAVFIIFLLEFFDDSIKTEAELEQISGLPVLGVIPDLDQIDHHRNYGEEDQNGSSEKK